jgi:uncharacterized membrane protein YhaH (DUF805 family)
VANSRTGRRPSPLAWLLISLTGRISRRVYWLAYLLIVSVQSALLAQMVGVGEASLHSLAAAIGPIVLLVTVYCSIAISAKRLHDVGYSGFLAIAILIPFLNVAFAIWVGLLPGTAGPNAYGDAADVPPS